MAKDKEKKPNIFHRWGRFFREVYGELKKVTWPTPKELLAYTATVLAFVVVVALMIGILDYAFGAGFKVLSDVNLGAAVSATATPAGTDAAATPDPTTSDAASTPAATN